MVFLGQAGTGKTSLIRQFVHRTFDQTYQATVGLDFVAKQVFPEGAARAVRLQLWDTAGQERFRALIPGYLRDSSAVIVVYDITSQQSFESARGWIDQALQDRSPGELVLALVGNKVDLEAQREVSREDGEAMANELKMLFFEASARTVELVDAIFNGVAQVLPSEVAKKAESDEEIILEPLRRDKGKGEKKKKCCLQ